MFQLWGVSIDYQAESLETGTTVGVIDSSVFAQAVTEADYEVIARRILEQQINRQDLRLGGGGWIHSSCSDVGSAPDVIYFDYYFRIAWLGMRTTIRGYPYQDQVEWYSIRLEQSPGDLNLSSRQVHIPQALEIVELNGGEDFRRAEQGDCEIRVDFGSEAGDDVWWVRYKTNTQEFCRLVDSQTGECHQCSR